MVKGKVELGSVACEGTPTRGTEIRAVAPLYKEIKFGTPIRLKVKVKNSGDVGKNVYLLVYHKSSEEGNGYYPFAIGTAQFVPGSSEKWFVMENLKVPAFAHTSWEGTASVRVEAYDADTGDFLTRRDASLYHAKAVGEFSIAIEEYCFCKGVDKNGYPIDPTDRFKVGEAVYFYVRSKYDGRGMRFTFSTLFGTSEFITTVYTTYLDFPSGKNWAWVAAYIYWPDGISYSGFLHAWCRVAGNSVVKKVAIIEE